MPARSPARRRSRARARRRCRRLMRRHRSTSRRASVAGGHALVRRRDEGREDVARGHDGRREAGRGGASVGDGVAVKGSGRASSRERDGVLEPDVRAPVLQPRLARLRGRCLDVPRVLATHAGRRRLLDAADEIARRRRPGDAARAKVDADHLMRDGSKTCLASSRHDAQALNDVRPFAAPGAIQAPRACVDALGRALRSAARRRPRVRARPSRHRVAERLAGRRPSDGTARPPRTWEHPRNHGPGLLLRHEALKMCALQTARPPLETRRSLRRRYGSGRVGRARRGV